MNTPVTDKSAAYQKAIVTLKEQKHSHQRALNAQIEMKAALEQELIAVNRRYADEIAKLDKNILIFQRELAASDAAIAEFEQMAGSK